MGFMASYKRLDNLCKDMNSVGVSGYINEMEDSRADIFSVPEWKDDYYKLKHYRYIRNRIAHDNDATEEMLCSPEDIEWIENFHQKLINQSDPLALIRKRLLKELNISKNTQPEVVYKVPKTNSNDKSSKALVSALSLFAIILFVIILYYFFG